MRAEQSASRRKCRVEEVDYIPRLRNICEGKESSSDEHLGLVEREIENGVIKGSAVGHQRNEPGSRRRSIVESKDLRIGCARRSYVNDTAEDAYRERRWTKAIEETTE